MMGGLRKKENYCKSDEQRVAVIKHVLNTSITDSLATDFLFVIFYRYCSALAS